MIILGGFFSIDGAFYKFGNAIADIMILSVLWILFSIPLITIGASTTALYYVTTRRISDKEGYLLKDFFSSFRSNFKQATVLWLFWVFLFVLVIANINLLNQIDFNPLLASFLLPLQVVLMVELIMIWVYLFPLTARFDMGFRQTLKSAFFMANRHFLTTLTSLVTGTAIFLSAVFIFEPIIFVAMGAFAYVNSYMIMNLFKRYRPELDADDVSKMELKPLPDDDLNKTGKLSAESETADNETDKTNENGYES